MAVDVVHRLEAVEVDHHQDARRVLADDADLLLGGGFVEKPGHRIGHGCLAQPRDLLNGLQDIADPPQQDIGTEGLANEIERAVLKALALCLIITVSSHEHEGDLSADLLF